MTTASVTWTTGWASSSTSWNGAGCSIGRSWSSPPTMARNSAIIPCSTTARACIAPRSACRSYSSRPRASPSPAVVKETVSLRDLPATIVDLAGLSAGSPFPGRSLAGLWRRYGGGDARTEAGLEGAVSELSGPNPSVPSQGRSPAARARWSRSPRGIMSTFATNGTRGEELFNDREDSRELINRAGALASQPVLERIRGDLERMRPGRARLRAGRVRHSSGRAVRAVEDVRRSGSRKLSVAIGRDDLAAGLRSRASTRSACRSSP